MLGSSDSSVAFAAVKNFIEKHVSRSKCHSLHLGIMPSILWFDVVSSDSGAIISAVFVRIVKNDEKERLG